MLKKIIISAIVALATQSVMAQEEKFTLEGQSGVIKLYSEKLVIEYDKNDNPIATSEIVSEVEVLNENNLNGFSSDEVYHSFFNELKKLKAFSMIPNDKGGFKKIEVDNYQVSNAGSNSVFYDDSKKTSFTFPSLVKNAHARMEYTIFHKDAHFLNAFYLQSHLPAEELYFEVEAPKDMDMNFVFKGKKIDWVVSSKDLGRNTVTYTFSCKNVPKLKVQPMSPSYSYYLPHVIPIIAKCKGNGKNTQKNFLSNPTDLYKFYYQHIADINVAEEDIIKTTTMDVIKGKTDDYQKASAIYKWVQANIKYVAFEDGMGGFVPRQAKDVCTKRYGDCKDMSSILVAMYRAAGFKSYLTWVGTRHIPYTYVDVPTPAVDNHMICAMYIKDKMYLVDGTHDNIPFGYAPQGIQNKECLIGVSADSFQIYKVPIAPAIQNVVYDTTIAKLVGNKIEGKVGIQYNGFSAWDLNYYYKMAGEQKKEEFIKSRTLRGSNKFLNTDGNITVQTDGDRKMFVNTKFTIDDYVQTVDDEIYINLNFIKNLESQKIDTKEQSEDIDNQFANTDYQVVYFDIPTGYDVTYLPAVKENKKDKHWQYKIEYKVEKNVIIQTKFIQYNLLDIKSTQIADHNLLIDELVEQYNESIILKKKKN
jgi:Transglutaminase-like superfamily/Domain of Unknown Function with PDB structure (DUF3857)